MDLFYILAAILRIFAISVLFTAIKFFYRYLNNYKLSPQLPALKVNPFIQYWLWFRIYRNSLSSFTSFVFQQLICGCSKIFQHEDLFMVSLLYRRIFILTKPSSVQTFLNNSATNDKSYEYKFSKPWLGNSIVTSNGKIWRKRHKLLAPAFHMKVLQGYIPIFNEQSAILISKMKSLLLEPWIDIESIISLCALDVICQSAMGVSIGAQTESEGSKEYRKALKECNEILVNRAAKPWTYPDFIFNLTSGAKEQSRVMEIIHRFSRKIIEKRRESILSQKEDLSLRDADEDSNTKAKMQKDFLEILLDYHLKDTTFTLEDVRAEVDTFIFGGFDTVTVAISWVLVLLGLNPDIQEKAYQEMISIFGEDRMKVVSYDDLHCMKYLECIIKETLRLYPPAPAVGREVNKDIKIGKYTIPGDSTAVLFIYMLHRDPECFPNPEKFDPDRFSSQNREKIHPYAFLPFSGIPRNCVGHRFAMMEMKVILSYILRNFSVKALDQTDQVELKWLITLRTLKPLRIKLSPRP